MDRYCIIPDWNTKTHSNFYRQLCNNLNLEAVTANEINRKLNFISFIYLVPVFFKIILNFRDFRKVYFKDICIGFSLNEELIARSKLGSVSINFDLFKLTFFSINFIINLNNFHKINPNFCAFAGDDLYIKFSLISQFCINNSLKCFKFEGEDKINFFNYDLKRFSSSYLPNNNFNKNNNYNFKYQEILNKGFYDYSYMNQRKKVEKFKIENNSVIIYLHDFFDSPGWFGGNVFRSHIEWITDTINFLIQNNIKFYLKRHPNEREKNIPVINFLSNKFKDLEFLENDFSLKTVDKSKIKYIISVNGTICFEALLFKIPVVTCSLNPYMKLNNVVNSASKEQYFENLKQIHNYRSNIKVDEEYIKSFELSYFSMLEKYDVPLNNVSEKQWIHFSQKPYLKDGRERYSFIKEKYEKVNYSVFNDFHLLINDIKKLL